MSNLINKYVSAYSPKKRIPIKFAKTGRTKQQHADKTNINLIMKKFLKTGIIDFTNKHEQQYGFATSDSFQESLQIIQTANEMFADLPSQLRIKFNHNPADFLDYVQDPKNEDTLFDLGLADFPLPPIITEEPLKESSESTVPT